MMQPDLDRINFQTVTLNLRRNYKPLAQVAREIQSDEATLNRLARGEVRQPRFVTALKLLDLHLDHCPAKHNLRELTR
jgi:hypothetical protein